MAYADDIKPIRNRMRRFAYPSVLQQLSAYIHYASTVDPRKPYEPTMPWLGERLALWVLRDDARLYGSKPMQRADLLACLNQAWTGMDSAFPILRPGVPLHLSIRAMLLAQIPHQKGQEMGPFGRQIDLLNRLDPNSHLYQVFATSLGMSPMDYLAMSVLFRFNSLNNMGRAMSSSYRNSLNGVFGEASVRQFFASLVVPREKTAFVMREISADEWLQPNLLYRSPFTEYEGRWYFWGRCGLDRHLEFALSDTVGASQDQQARALFETLFEAYVGRALGRMDAQLLKEDEVRQRFNVEDGCGDYAVVASDSVVLLEVKNKALAHTIPAFASVRTFRSKLKATLLKGAEQLRNTSRFVRNHVPHAVVFRVVVTYGDFLVGETDYLFDESADNVRAEDPVFVMSVDDLDRLIEAVRLGQCTFASFFEDFSRRRLEPTDRLFSLSQLLNMKPYRLTQQPKHVVDTYTPFLEGMLERVQAADLAANNV